MRKMILAVAVAALPSMASAQGVGELLQGIIDPHIVAGVGYNSDAKTYSAILTANVVGPKLGSIPCYISGVGVALGSVAPGLENSPIAAASLPFLTCAPFGEKVALQVGMSRPLNGSDFGNTYYFGAGLDLGGGPNELKAKRIKRIQARAERAKKAANDGPPQPTAP
jgi:hypothetical protein